jgi:hypothetical protein
LVGRRGGLPHRREAQGLGLVTTRPRAVMDSPPDPDPSRALCPLPAGAAINQRRGGSTRTSFPRFNICAIAQAFSICAYV